MDVREKLVELLGADICKYNYCEDCECFENEEDCFATIKYSMADHLIAHSITTQEWISVDDRLPEFCVSVLARCFHHGKWRTLVCHTSKENAGEWYTDEVCQWVKVTHWMPLPPELPKEGADNGKTD